MSRYVYVKELNCQRKELQVLYRDNHHKIETIKSLQSYFCLGKKYVKSYYLHLLLLNLAYPNDFILFHGFIGLDVLRLRGLMAYAGER